MSSQETNPHFLQPEPQPRDQQPLLPHDWEQHHHPDLDSRTPPRQHQDQAPLGAWRGLTQHSPHHSQAPPMQHQDQGPLGAWRGLTQHSPQEPVTAPPKLKKQKRRKDSQPSDLVVSSQPPPHGGHPPAPFVPQLSGSQPPTGSQPPAGNQPESHSHPAPAKSSPPTHRRPQSLLPEPRRTKLPTWFGAVLCAIFSIIIILGGLAVLIVYLVFRPKSPRFDIMSVSLNAAYLDMGYLLNADVTILANFTNSNHKVRVDFSSMYLDLYFENTPIATQYVPPFSAARRQSWLADIHMMSSQVPLPIKESQLLQKQIENSRVMLQVKGRFRARSNFGSLLRYSYWLHGYCSLVVSSPPTGVLKGKNCITKQ